MRFKAVVIGGAGFIGSHIVDRLNDMDAQVIVADDLSTGSPANVPNNDIKYLKVNKDQQVWADVLSNTDYVFYLAAKARVQPSIKNPAEYHHTNVNGFFQILEILRHYNKDYLKKIIYSSSSSVYGNPRIFPTPERERPNPLSPYALQKWTCEEYLKLYHTLYNIPYVTLRYFNVYGERMTTNPAYRTVINIFIDQKKEKKPLTINGNGLQVRDFTYVGDVADANITAALNGINNKTINIGSGKPVSVEDIASIISKKKTYLPPVREPHMTCADNTKAKKLLNWKPTVDVESWLKNYL